MRVLLALSLITILTGCAKVVDDFVQGGEELPPPAPPPVATSDDDYALKLSPGMVRSTGGSLGMTARITTSRHVMTGTSVSAIVGLHKSR